MEEIGDLKAYLKINTDKIRDFVNIINSKNSLAFALSNCICNCTKSDYYWLEYFTYQPDLNPIESFLRYRAAAEFKLYDGPNDCDITEPVMNHFKNILSNILSDKKKFPRFGGIKIGKEIDKNDKDIKYRTIQITLDTETEPIYLDTDTACSLATDLNQFFRNLLKRKYGAQWCYKTYIPKYGLSKPSKSFRSIFFIEMQHNIADYMETTEDLSCYHELEKRSKYVHTLKNMMLVPYGYNSPRGLSLSTCKTNRKINDRLDLTLLDYHEMLEAKVTDENFQTRLAKHIKKGKYSHKEYTTIQSVEFLLAHRDELIPVFPSGKFMNPQKSSICDICRRSRAINAVYEASN